MKTKNNSIIGLVFVGAILLASCNQSDVKMHTIVNKDGTCTREVSYSNVMKKEVRDSLWGEGKTGWSQPIPDNLNVDAFDGSRTDVREGDTVTTTFWKIFHSAEEMCQQTPIQLNGARLQSKATIAKRFRWFYTEYTFTETFSCVGDTFKLPATDYADKDVVSYWFTGQPNLLQGMSGAEASEELSRMESKITQWLNGNLFKTGFDFIVSNYDSIANPPVSRERFVELQDSMARRMLKGHDDVLSIEPTEAFRQFFNSDAYAMFFDEHTSYGKALNREFTNRMNILWFTVPYTLSMPGKIVDAGTGVIKDGVIFYPLTGERLIPHDYVITATSRVTHVWAFIATFLVILLAIGSFLYKRKIVSEKVFHT